MRLHALKLFVVHIHTNKLKKWLLHQSVPPKCHVQSSWRRWLCQTAVSIGHKLSKQQQRWKKYFLSANLYFGFHIFCQTAWFSTKSVLWNYTNDYNFRQTKANSASHDTSCLRSIRKIGVRLWKYINIGNECKKFIDYIWYLQIFSVRQNIFCELGSRVR